MTTRIPSSWAGRLASAAMRCSLPGWRTTRSQRRSAPTASRRAVASSAASRSKASGRASASANIARASIAGVRARPRRRSTRSAVGARAPAIFARFRPHRRHDVATEDVALRVGVGRHDDHASGRSRASIEHALFEFVRTVHVSDAVREVCIMIRRDGSSSGENAGQPAKCMNIPLILAIRRATLYVEA